ncbi:MAG: hypothetical protein P8I93_05265 [Crocinitomicaceae bacterium]|nr:hypothetical protein [Crocinitomicaceae bacterium]
MLHGQNASWRKKKIKITNTPLRIDTLSIYPNSFYAICNQDTLKKSDYVLDFAYSKFQLLKNCNDSILIGYKVLPIDLSKSYQKRDSSVVFTQKKGERENFLITEDYSVEDVFGGSELNKSGSISRGISFGNNQDLGVNSSLNLELSGKLSPNLNLLASLSDANIPIQPDGTTNKLQEFDKIFIQVYNKNLKIIAGDFWLSKPKGYFLTYKKRGQGITSEYTWKTKKNTLWYSQISGALSKGKFSRQIIQGVESNQGPYRLVGKNNEPFIIILAGTERVYIDGKLLIRGQENDYIVDYNTAEIVFTSRNLITKDSRIVVEFQYSDQSYARSLLQGSIHRKTKKMEFWFNAYSEQDAKNQPLQQSLDSEQKNLLSLIGDSLSLANTSSIDSIGYLENQILYKLLDTLGVDSVLVFSVASDSAFYRASFLNVGPGNGDYILEEQIALGKVYKWVSPLAGIKQGEYMPQRIVGTPKQKRLVSTGFKYKIGKKTSIKTEIAYSENDINTFSRLDQKDNFGYSLKSEWLSTFKFKPKDSLNKWSLQTMVDFEALSTNFSPIEQFRAVEFDRDWNTRNQTYEGAQYSTSIQANFIHKKNGNIKLNAKQYSIGDDYLGLRGKSDFNWKRKTWSAIGNASILSSEAIEKNTFLRHKTEFSKTIKKFKIGYKDDHEKNSFIENNGLVSLKSYQFFDYQFYISNMDSAKIKYKVFYRERFDWKSDSTRLKKGAKATTAGIEIKIPQKNQQLSIISGYRQLKIIDTNIMKISPENTVIGRIEYNLKLLKGALSFSSFYEIGSGLEQRRDFIYLKVNDGQGIYTWIDYNQDGVQDLNEFEIAQFVDQASYIRVFTPSAAYVNIYSNEFNQGVYWRPERIWSSKKGILNFLSKFSNQFRMRVKRKTGFLEANLFNPFDSRINDTNLIQTHSLIRNSVFFNRTSSIFASEYRYQESKSKNLLATGFDGKSISFHELSTRWNIISSFSWENSFKTELKESNIDYTTGRNYSIQTNEITTQFNFQPNTKLRIGVEGKYLQRQNLPVFGGEVCYHTEIGVNGRLNHPKKGSFQSQIKGVSLIYDGTTNSAVGFEMLQGLKPGINYIWEIGYQRLISKNLQLSIHYNGRKSENSSTIHSGSMELRALF